MMKTQMAGDPAQAHPIHIQLERFLAHFLGIRPGLGIGCILFHAVHADIALAAARGFACSVLTFGSVTFRTLHHICILPKI